MSIEKFFRKKVFKIIGLISLTCFSFFITEKTSLVVKNMDDIMISIRENSDNYKSKSIDAKIDGDTIICKSLKNLDKMDSEA